MHKIKSALLVFLLTPLLSAAPVDGIYATADENYRIDVRFEPGKLTVIEPNKTSVYTRRAGTDIYDFTNPSNDISYVLEVTDDGRGLKAYKSASPANFTPLKLISVAKVEPAAPTAPAAGVVKIPVENPRALNPDLEELWGVREVPGLQVTGTYRIGRDAHPITTLNTDGSGVFEMFGAPNPRDVYEIRWWIQANRDGTLVAKDYPAAVQYMLIVEYVDKPYQGNRFDRIGLAVEKADDGAIFMFERRKPKKE